MKIKQLSETTAGAVASVAMPIGKTHKRTEEAANPAQQAAIAVNMKKAGKKPKNLKESYVEKNPDSFLDDDFYAFDPETKVIKGTWSHKSVGRRHHEYEAQQKGYEVVSGMRAKRLGLLIKSNVEEGKDESLRKAITDYDYNKNNQQPVAPSPEQKAQIKKDVSDYNKEKEEKQKQGVKEDWQKVNKSDNTDGMSRKAVKAYRRENPGSKLKTAVTTKPSKLKKGSKSAKRRKSFCARMSGMKKAHASAKTKRNPDSPINKALRRWNCESIEDMRNLIENAERMIAEEKKRLDPKCWDGYKKQGTKMKGGVRVNNCVPIEEEKPGLYANVNAKRERIKHGSGERMRKPGTKGAPSAQAWRDAAKTAKTESNIMRGMVEAHISEEELLLAPGQGVRFKTELMPKRTDHEVEMARNQLRSSFENAKHIYQNIKDLSEIQGLDGWVQAKITKASDYLEAVNQYLEGKKEMLEIQSEVDHQVEEQYPAQQYNPRGVPLKPAPAAPLNVPQGWQANTQADGSTRISKTGSMPRAQYQQNMANYKAQNWTPEKIADYQTRIASGQGYSDAEKYANYQAGVKATGREDPETLAMLIPDENVRNQLQQPTNETDNDNSYMYTQRSYTNQDGDESFNRRTASIRPDSQGNTQVRAVDTGRALGDEMTINATVPKNVKINMVPQKGTANIEETGKLSPREKFKRGLKRAGYDPDAGADRLLKLIARQAEERKEFERKQKEQDEEFYKNRKLKEQDPQPVDNKQQEQPKSNKLFDVLKSIGDVALPVGRAIYGMQNRDIPADVKGEIKTRLHNYVTGEPNK